MSKKPYPLGAYAENNQITFRFASKAPSCGVFLYGKADGEKIKKISFSEEDRIGNVYTKTIDDIDATKVSYLFYEGEQKVADERARMFTEKFAYGESRPTESCKAGFVTEKFPWEEDKRPHISYGDMFLYCMHVRGFTKHVSSGVAHPGTFAGIMEKIPYLKRIGVTSIELQPAYEFEDRNNYWGYIKGYYYTPKAAYAASEDAVCEFKTLVKELHKNGLELVMQFYFPKGIKKLEILEILRFWVLEYHVDGFHLMGEDIPCDLLMEDECLADTKLMYYGFDVGYMQGAKESAKYPHLAEYNDGWYYDMRRFLRGDENTLSGVMYQMRHIPAYGGKIHYLSNYSGFTLADTFAYDYKHNEANGEDNRDGSDYNCSFNCGVEGDTDREEVLAMRLQQIKNAFCLLFLSSSTPMIFMGDEFGNSQMGNNNPYCQDNEITWLNWDLSERNKEILEFFRSVVAFRREHSILRPEKELYMRDYRGFGCPDLSYHGLEAWRPRTEMYHRYLGLMFFEKYATGMGSGDSTIFVAMNMHREPHVFALPKAPKGGKFRVAFSTAGGENTTRTEDEGTSGMVIREDNLLTVPARTIVVCVTDRE